MTTLTIALDPFTAEWLHREAATENTMPELFVAELLRELADPDQVEGNLIDRLLAEATRSFPGVMELEEQAEMRDEVLDDLCRRLVESHRQMLGELMTLTEQAAFRAKLEERAKIVWG
jgi:hypothetical protein